MALRKIIIGRSTDCDLVLADMTVSRRHAELEILDNNRLLLTDYESTHGTFLIKNGNEEKVTQQLVTKYDVLRFGKAKMSVSEILSTTHFHEQDVFEPQFTTNQTPTPNYNYQNTNDNLQSQDSSRQNSMTFSDLYFSFNGRISRSTYWLKYLLPYILLMMIFILIEISNHKSPNDIRFHSLVLYLIIFIPSLSMNVKRCHDRNKSGWFLFINVLPVIGSLWFLIETAFIGGKSGTNKYGPDPLK